MNTDLGLSDMVDLRKTALQNNWPTDRAALGGILRLGLNAWGLTHVAEDMRTTVMGMKLTHAVGRTPAMFVARAAMTTTEAANSKFAGVDPHVELTEAVARQLAELLVMNMQLPIATEVDNATDTIRARVMCSIAVEERPEGAVCTIVVPRK